MKKVLGLFTFTVLMSAQAMALPSTFTTTCYASDGHNPKYMRVDVIEQRECLRCGPGFHTPYQANVSIFAGAGRPYVTQVYKFESVQYFRLTQTTYAKEKSYPGSSSSQWQNAFPDKIVIWGTQPFLQSIAINGQSFDLQCPSAANHQN